MAENELIRRYLDAGIAFTQMTRQRAEDIVRDLVKAGEVQTEQTQQLVEELVNRSRENTEKLFESVREQVNASIANLGLATRDDIARLEARIDAISPAGATPAPAKRATKKLVVPSGADVGPAAKKAAGTKKAAKKAGGAAKQA
jgi:polyhydroxyalkanoate synthesis regulator phasin